MRGLYSMRGKRKTITMRGGQPTRQPTSVVQGHRIGVLFYVHRLFFDRHYIQIQSVQGEEYVGRGESVESALKICETGCDCEGREMLCCLLWLI